MLIIPIDEMFFSIVNPLINDGFKIINHRQKSILDMINDKNTVEDISNYLEISRSDLEKTLAVLKTKEFINYTGVFSRDIKTKKIDSIDFWVHTTDNCNLNCNYCYIVSKYSKKNMDTMVLNKLFERIIETVKIYKLKKVSLRLAGGEPLLMFDSWSDLIRQLKNNLSVFDCSLKVTVLTNLVLLNEKMINYFKQENIDVSISLDGIKEFHDINRKTRNNKGSFDYVQKNLDRLIEAKVVCGVNTTINNDNMEGLYELTKFIIKRNIPFRFSFVQGEELDKKRLKKNLIEVYKLFEHEIDNGYNFSKFHRLCDLKFFTINYRNCGQGYSSASIDPDGNIIFCQKNIGKNNISGSIFDSRDIIDMMQSGDLYKSLSVSCSKCECKNICAGGCPLELKKGKSPYCNLFKYFIPIIYKLLGKERLYLIKKSGFLLSLLYSCAC